VSSQAEPGAAVSVWHGGREVVALAGGWQDARRTRPFTTATLAQVYSTGKPVAALAALTAVADGRLELDAPIAAVWPAYAQNGKEATTLRQVLSHTAGVPTFSPVAAGYDALDRDALLRDLAAATPIGEPGAVIAEHALTYGHLIEGVLAGAGAPDTHTATSDLGRLLGVELWFGVPPSEQARVADLEVIDGGWVDRYREHPLGIAALAVPDGRLDPARLNTAEWRATSFPADGLITSASALGRFYDDLHRADGIVAGRLGAELHRELLTTQVSGFDHFLQRDASWSLGLNTDDGEIGMGGIGGSCAWYSPAHDYAMAYVTRGLGTHDRADRVATAVEDALAARRVAR
jgi:CubicO group peptidase (beta-lactamase class C family)